MFREGGDGLEATLNGCRIYYELQRCDRPGAPNVLFLHGWGCDSSMFSFLTSGFMPDATVAAIDFPGHGKSDEPPAPWGVAEFAEQVRAFILQNHLEPVHLIAHSFGGRIALWLASHYPELIARLVLTGGAGLKKPVSDRSRRRTARFKRYNALLEKAKAGPLTALAEGWQAKLRAHYGSPDYVKLNENMRKTFVKIVSEDLFPLLDQVRASTLLIWGDKDTETPLWMAETMAEHIADSAVIVFEGGTHFAFLEQWQRFLLITRQFILEEQG